MSRYTCRCIAPGCPKVFEVDTERVGDAITAVMADGEDHNLEFHPELPILTTEKIRLFVSKNIRKLV